MSHVFASKIGLLPQCKIGKRKRSTLSAGEANNTSSRRRSGELKTKPSDPGTNVSNGVQEPERTRFFFCQKHKLYHRSPNKTTDDSSSECKPQGGLLQSKKRLNNIHRKLARPPFPWALTAAFHSLLFLFLTAGTASGELSQATKDMVQFWAPKLWIHHEEKFRPSNVDYFLENTQVEDAGGAVVQASPTVSTIEAGPGSEDYNLNTLSAITGKDISQGGTTTLYVSSHGTQTTSDHPSLWNLIRTFPSHFEYHMTQGQSCCSTL